MIITFQGASDDLVEIDGAPGADEFNVYPVNAYAGTWLVQDDEWESGKLRFYVDAYYWGTWSFSLRLVDEGELLPEDMLVLTTTNETINAYTTLLWIDTGDVNVKIIRMDNRGKTDG